MGRWVVDPAGVVTEHDDYRRARLLVDGMVTGLEEKGRHVDPAEAERLREAFAAGMPLARAGRLTPDVLRDLLRRPAR